MGLFDPLWSLFLWAFVFLLFVGGLASVWESVGLFRDVFWIVFTRTSPVSDVREGRVEVSGTARAADAVLEDPVTGAEAVAYEYRVTEEKHLKDDLIEWTRWGYREVADGGVAVPFSVDDGTDRVLVDPGAPDDEHKARSGAVNLYATREEEVHVDGDGRTPDHVGGLFERTDASPPDDDLDRVYETARVEPGDDVYVLGTGTFRDGERVVEGGDGRFVVAGASQLRTVVYNAWWGVFKFVGGALLALVCGYLLLWRVAELVGVPLRLF